VNDPWWSATTPAEATVRCGGRLHRIRWEEGQLVALDHPDPGREGALASLGVGPPACLSLRQRWTDHRTDPRVLVLGARHPGESVVAGGEELALATRAAEALLGDADRAADPGKRARLRAEAAALSDDVVLAELLSLHAPVQRRLQQQVAAGLAARAGAGDGEALAVLEAATVGRLLPVLRRWRPGRAWEVTLGEPAIRDGPVVRVTVEPSWVAEVWGPYLAVADGHLVLAVHRADPTRAEVTAVAGPDCAAERVVLAGPAPWHVAS